MPASKATVLLENRVTACESAQLLSLSGEGFRKKVKPEDREKSVTTAVAHLVVEDDGLVWPSQVQVNLLGLSIENSMRQLAGYDKEKQDLQELCDKLCQALLPVESAVAALPDASSEFDPDSPLSFRVLCMIRDKKAEALRVGEEDAQQIEDNTETEEHQLMEALMDGFGCDDFISMIQDPQKHKVALEQLCRSFLTLWQSQSVKDEVEAEKTVIKDGVKRLANVCKAFLVLLSPEVGVLGTNVSDLAALVNYRGNQDFEQSMKLILNTSKALAAQTNDILKTASATVTMGGEQRSTLQPSPRPTTTSSRRSSRPSSRTFPS